MADAKTYSGACHCGAVSFEASADLSNVIVCNCSICQSKGLTLTFAPAAQVTISGESELTEYRFNTHKIAHQFCRTCGVQPVARAEAPDGTPMVAINVRCLKDVDFEGIATTPVDGRSR